MSVSLITGSFIIPFDAIGSFSEDNKTVGLERLGQAPETDFYLFSLSDTQTITINLSDISPNGDADLKLFSYTDIDGDGPISDTDALSIDPDDSLGLLATSFTPGSADETISITLGPGTYAVQVSRADASLQQRLSYDIDISSTPVMSLPDPTPINPTPVDFSYIDALLFGDRNKWGNSQTNNPDDTTVITYSFWSDASLDDAFENTDTVDTPWFNYEIDAIETALDMWASVANIEFVQVNDNNAAANLKLALVNNFEIGDGVTGSASPPQVAGEGLTYFNWEGLGWNVSGLQPGGKGFITVMQELGHALGLAHPHDDDNGSLIFPGVEPIRVTFTDLTHATFYTTGLFDLNQGVWTTMSDNDGRIQDNTSRLVDYGFQGSPMTFDIAAIQTLYGVNPNHNSGDDVYTLPTENAPGTYYMALWDTGGDDTISAIASLDPVTIDLNDAPLTGSNAGGYISSVDGVYGGFTIANGVVIENAVGGAGDDVLIGNEVANIISGWDGDDVIFGEAGDDLIDGDDGDDLIDGGSGDDTILGADGEDFLDGWLGNDTLFGNAGDDTLLGFDGSDTLYGGQGSDVLLGEAGSDALVGYDGGIEEYDVLVGDLSTSAPDQTEITDGADRFVLGDSTTGVYYLGLGYATISDFYWLEGDVIQVYGSISNYSLDKTQDWSGSSALDTVIRYQNDIIGIVEDTTDVLLSQDFDVVV